jgi:hypothetical protein
MKIVFRGVFATSPEQWSFSTKWNSDISGTPDPHPDDIHADGVLAALNGLLGNSSFSAGVKCTEWRAYDIGTDGNMVGEPRQELMIPGSEPQGSSGSKHPSQVSLCVTTVGDSRGPGRFGRFYLPGPAAAVQADWRISEADCETYLTLAVDFVKAVSNAIDIPLSAGSVPLTNISAKGTGAKQTVHVLQVGRVLDTQRRRRNKLLEAYEVSAGSIDW